MDGGHTADYGFVFHANVPGKGPVIGYDAAAAHTAVVRHMTVSHEKIGVADDGLATFTGARIQSAVFPDDVPVSYDKRALFSFEFKVLRSAADHRPAEYFAVSAYAGIAFNNAMRPNPGARVNSHIIADNGEWSDFHVFSELCLI
jgi:hypothetical protein